jgi:hypothetical protein
VGDRDGSSRSQDNLEWEIVGKQTVKWTDLERNVVPNRQIC